MAAMMLMPLLAHAQTGERVIAAPDPSPPYWQTCKHVWQRTPYVAPTWSNSIYVPVPSSTPSSGGGGVSSGGGGGGSLSGLGGGGGSGAGYALLVLAVIAIAALPVIVYAVDDDADPLTVERFYCPEFNFGVMGGVQVPTSRGAVTGLGVAKIRADVGYVGAMAEVGLTSVAGALAPGFSAHFLLRPVPKKHIEGALALGARRAIGPGGTLDGAEIALPHTYVFSRDGYRKFGLELMPRFFWNQSGLDAGADLNLVVPIADVLQLRVGAAVFSHRQQIQLSAGVGLNAYL